MHQYSRRELLARGAAVGAAAVAAPAVLGAIPASASAATDSLGRSRGHGQPVLDSVNWLQQWEERMVGLGNRMGGTRALSTWVDLLEDQLQRLGLSTFRDTQQMPAATPAWNATGWKLSVVDGFKQTPIEVASYYPYSGVTSPGGITAEVVDIGAGTAADFTAQDLTGKIVLVEAPYPSAFQTYGSWFDTSNTGGPGPQYLTYDPDHTIKSGDIYRTCFDYGTVTGGMPALAAAAGAAGLVIVMDAAPNDALGQYLPFGRPFQSMPTLYLDRVAGKKLQTRVDAGPATARLTLTADIAPSSVDNLTAIMPGSNPNEYVLVLTHLDGVGTAEENGGFALLAMARYLSQLPPSSRNRSIIFHFTYHMTPYVATNGIDFQTFHPDLYDKSVTVFGIEHLGQMNWVDNNNTDQFYPTHRTEVAQLGVNTNAVLAGICEQALKQHRLGRNLVCTNIRGVGSPHKTNLPSMGYCPLENNLVSFAGDLNLRMGTFSASLMREQLQTWLTAYKLVDATSTTTLFSSGGPYANTPPSP
jgi:hypothetical protein